MAVRDTLYLSTNNLLLDGNVFSPQPTNDGFPAEHVKDPVRLTTTQIQGTSVELRCSFPQITTIHMAALFYTNLTNSAEIIVEHSIDTFSVQITEFGRISAAGPDYQVPHVVLPDEPGANFDWRFRIEDPGNTDGFIELGVAYLGGVWQPTQGGYIRDSFGLEAVDEGQTVYGPGNVPHVGVGETSPQISFQLTNQTENDAFGQFFPVAMAAGYRKDFFIGFDPLNADLVRGKQMSLYGRFTQLPRFNLLTRSIRGSADIVVRGS